MNCSRLFRASGALLVLLRNMQLLALCLPIFGVTKQDLVEGNSHIGHKVNLIQPHSWTMLWDCLTKRKHGVLNAAFTDTFISYTGDKGEYNTSRPKRTAKLVYKWKLYLHALSYLKKVSTCNWNPQAWNWSLSRACILSIRCLYLIIVNIIHIEARKPN